MAHEGEGRKLEWQSSQRFGPGDAGIEKWLATQALTYGAYAQAVAAKPVDSGHAGTSEDYDDCRQEELKPLPEAKLRQVTPRAEPVAKVVDFGPLFGNSTK